MANFFRASDLIQERSRVKLAVAVFLLISVSWMGVIDDVSVEYVDGALIQASVAFGSARLLNGLISVLQSATVEFSFIVTGGTVGVGEVLDPINDLVEQYSSMMKLSIGSLVIQKVLLGIVSDTLFKVLLTLSGLVVVVSLMRQSMPSFGPAAKTFLFLLFIRFSLVLVVAMNGFIDKYFMVDQTRQDIATLQSLPASVDGLGINGVPSEELESLAHESARLLDERETELRQTLSKIEARRPGLLAALKTAEADLADVEQKLTTVQRMNVFAREAEHAEALARVDSAREQLEQLQGEVTAQQRQIDLVAKEREAMAAEGSGGFMSEFGGVVSKLVDPQTYLALKEKMESAVDTILQIMAVFILRTLILPLLFLYALSKAFKAIWGIDARELLSRRARHSSVNRETGGTNV